MSNLNKILLLLLETIFWIIKVYTSEEIS